MAGVAIDSGPATRMKSPPDRIGWIDAAKGLAVSLVVFGHVLGSAIARNWISSDGGGLLCYNFIYTFHMPLFFIISGALAIDGMRVHPGQAFVFKVGSIAWPYLIWGTISILLHPFIFRFMLSPHSATLSE